MLHKYKIYVYMYELLTIVMHRVRSKKVNHFSVFGWSIKNNQS